MEVRWRRENHIVQTKDRKWVNNEWRHCRKRINKTHHYHLDCNVYMLHLRDNTALDWGSRVLALYFERCHKMTLYFTLNCTLFLSWLKFPYYFLYFSITVTSSGSFSFGVDWLAYLSLWLWGRSHWVSPNGLIHLLSVYCILFYLF